MRDFYDKNRTIIFGVAIFLVATIALFLKLVTGSEWMAAVGAASAMWTIKRSVQVHGELKNVDKD